MRSRTFSRPQSPCRGSRRGALRRQVIHSAFMRRPAARSRDGNQVIHTTRLRPSACPANHPRARAPSSQGLPPSRPPEDGNQLRIAWRGLLRALANLPLAIAELAALAALSAVGTVIEQNRSPDYYRCGAPCGVYIDNVLISCIRQHQTRVFALGPARPIRGGESMGERTHAKFARVPTSTLSPAAPSIPATVPARFSVSSRRI